jgi:hypothetical protein
MTQIKISGAGLAGTLRLRLVDDGLAHVLKHAGNDEPSGTWTGLGCPRYRLAIGSDIDPVVLAEKSATGEVADLHWEAPAELVAEHNQAHLAAMRAYHAEDVADAERHWRNVEAIWSRAWAANYQALEFMQGTGGTRFGPAGPQQWVVASFEHHCGSHGVERPHVHNIVLISLTTGTRKASAVGQYDPAAEPPG